MIEFVRDLMAHSEWANAVFFQAWGDSRLGNSRKCAGESAILSGAARVPVNLAWRKPGNPSHRCSPGLCRYQEPP